MDPVRRRHPPLPRRRAGDGRAAGRDGGDRAADRSRAVDPRAGDTTDAQRDDDPRAMAAGCWSPIGGSVPLWSAAVPTRSVLTRAARAHPPADLAVEQLGRRDRLIAAMAVSIERNGYRETTVADVVRLARTSRRSFYEHFEDRDACFLALFDATNDAMMRRDRRERRPCRRSLDEQVDAAVDAYIVSVTEQPTLFASLVRELPGLGAGGAQRSAAAVERFAHDVDRAGRRGRAGTAGRGPAAVDDGHGDHHRRRSARAAGGLGPGRT